MGAKLLLLTPCDYALTSANGKLSAIGIFDDITMPANGVSLATFFVVAQMLLDSVGVLGKKSIRVSIAAPSGEIVIEDAVDVDLSDVSRKRVNVLMVFPLGKFDSKGAHTISVAVDGVPFAETRSIDVK
ncbi:MAG: hypothetical protein JWO36_1923 [Myxococcales bacterium]|nr:hypothetical protein [Myxococcales bacterium]